MFTVYRTIGPLVFCCRESQVELRQQIDSLAEGLLFSRALFTYTSENIRQA